MNTSIVDIQNVSLSYQEQHAETLAVEGLSFSVEEGEFVSIIGPSGCGKTTVLSLLMGLIQPTSGSILVMGKPAGTCNSSVATCWTGARWKKTSCSRYRSNTC